MYLTRFEFNTRRRGSRFVLASPQRIHASVMSSFPGGVDPGRVLWRLDHGDHGRRELLIMAAERPDLTALVEECGWPTVQGWQTADASSLLGGLSVGQRWRFRVTANPVKSLVVPNGKRGKPVPLTASGQQEWLLSRQQALGVTLTEMGLGAQVTRRDLLRFSKDGGHQVTLSIAQFDGVLEVVDPVILRGHLAAGIGRAKAYGCGLMTLAPVR